MLPVRTHRQSIAGMTSNVRKGTSLLMLSRFINLAIPYEFAEETDVKTWTLAFIMGNNQETGASLG